MNRKQCIQQFFFCCDCIQCCWRVFTEPLPSSDW
jgi:hypothetical protein